MYSWRGGGIGMLEHYFSYLLETSGITGVGDFCGRSPPPPHRALHSLSMFDIVLYLLSSYILLAELCYPCMQISDRSKVGWVGRVSLGFKEFSLLFLYHYQELIQRGGGGAPGDFPPWIFPHPPTPLKCPPCKTIVNTDV